MSATPPTSSSSNSSSSRPPRGTPGAPPSSALRAAMDLDSASAPQNARSNAAQHFLPVPQPPPPPSAQPAAPPTLMVPLHGTLRPPSQTPPMSSSSSPPTPSPLATSGNSAHSRLPAEREKLTTATAASIAAPGTSASIHAAAAASFTAPSPSTTTAATAAAMLKAMAAGGDGAEAGGSGDASKSTGVVASAGASVSAPVSLVAPVYDDEAARAREMQRQQILAHANDLLTFCAIGNKVTSIRQCTSSFFVLLYQRLFDCTIAGIDRSPNTAEKRRHNVTLVLEQLRQHPYSLENIAAEEVVRLNEDHISRLIMVFVQIALDMHQHGQMQQQQQQQQLELASSSHAAAGVAVGMPPGAMTAGGVDYGLARNTAGAYVPVGYTVAEVSPSDTPYPYHPHQQHNSSVDRGGAAAEAYPAAAGAAAAPPLPPPPLLQHGRQRYGVEDFYVAPAPPLNGASHSAAPAAAAAAAGGGHYDAPSGGPSPPLAGGAYVAYHSPADAEESPSSVSYYLDSSAIPTDELLAEWYRNLVYPAPGAVPSEHDGLHHSTSASSRRDSDDERGATFGQHPQRHRVSGLPHASSAPQWYGGEKPPAAASPAVREGEESSITRTSRSSASAAGRPPQQQAYHRHTPPAQQRQQHESSRSPFRPTRKSGGGGGGEDASPSRRAQAATAAGHAAGGGTRKKPMSPAGRRSPRLDAQDIMRRCQRLGDALDAQEMQHRHAAEFVSPVKSHGDKSALARLDDSNTSRLHRGLPVQHSVRRRLSSGEKDERERDTSLLRPAPSGREQAAGGRVLADAQARQNAATSTHATRRPPLQHRSRPVVEPPLTARERDLLRHRPQQHSEAAQRDRKIERLRAARYLGDMQQLLRQRMRHEYDAQMADMRNSLKASLQSAQRDKVELMRRVRDENARYRAAYATLMEAAANEAQVPVRVMSRHTAQLADYYATALQHSNSMCEALKQETDRQARQELLQYAEEVSAWQQHFLL